MLSNKGFAISGILYAILILFMVILVTILGILGSRKAVLDKTKYDVFDKLNDEKNIVNDHTVILEVTFNDTKKEFNKIANNEEVNYEITFTNDYINNAISEVKCDNATSEITKDDNNKKIIINVKQIKKDTTCKTTTNVDLNTLQIN